MVTNIAFDNGHPLIREGADEGELSLVGDRVRVTDASARAVSFTLERSVNGGTTWEPVLAEVISGDGANLTDYESLSYGDTLYRAVAFTTEGATAETTITVEARSGALWLSGGAAYGVTGRLPFNPKTRITAGRARALKQYAGRSHPVALSGEALNRSVSVSGMTADRSWDEETTANVDHLSVIAQLEDAVFLFRDPDGRRVYGSIDVIDMSRDTVTSDVDGWNGVWGYAFTLTEADRSAR
jgi:hypothetical protein